MPSPIAHTAAAYAIYRASRSDKKGNEGPARVHRAAPFLFVVFLSLLPDFDFIPGILAGNIDGFHNTFSHSLFSGVIVAFLGAAILHWVWSGSALRWFALVLVSYELHVVMDYFTFGRGVMLLWPFSDARYEPPVILFYGLRRSSGLITIKHLWTILSEGVFAAVVILITNGLLNRSSSKKVTGQTAEAKSSITSG
ncbi:MAG: metal-dependent hydrolase [Chloroflexota bacterium]